VILHAVFTCHVSSVFGTFCGNLESLFGCFFLCFVCGHVSRALFCQFHGHFVISVWGILCEPDVKG